MSRSRNAAANPSPQCDVRLAASASVGVCEHGNVYFRLHDKAGKVFAAAIMPKATALNVVDEILGGLEGGGGSCEGHA